MCVVFVSTTYTVVICAVLIHCDSMHSVFLQELVLQHRDSQESILVEIPSHVYVGIFNVNLQEVRLAISKKHAVRCITGVSDVALESNIARVVWIHRTLQAS